MRRSIAAVAAAVTLAACGSDGDPAAPACTTAVREPVLPADMVADLGVLRVGSQARFSVSDDTSSFFIFSQEADGSAPDTVSASGFGRIPNAVVPTDLRAPDGTVYYDDFEPWPLATIAGVGGFPDVTRMLAYDIGFRAISGGLQVPNTSGALDALDPGGTGVTRVPIGTWTFTVNDWARACPFGTGCADGNTASRYRVHVVRRPVQATGRLDVEVYLATDETSQLPTVARANASGDVARWKGTLAHYLRNAGITLGEVTFREVSRAVKDRYAPNGAVDLASTGPCSDLNQLFATATQPKRAVHLFLADEFVAGREGSIEVAGVDGSIPGPSGFPGTIYGGAILALNDDLGAGACGGAAPDLGCGTDRLAYVAAHEIGHWLGLYHTTEQSGRLFDPVDDTPICACSACGGCGTDVQMFPDKCAGATADCGGARNLMFWLVTPDSVGELSADQGAIARLNPAVQ